MKNYIRLSILIATAGLIGCSKTGDMTNVELSKASCVSSKAVDPDSLAIEGGAAAEPGEAVRYSLNEDVNCAPDTTVAWRTIAGGSKLNTTGGTFVSSFKKPGEYVVAARVTSDNSTYEVSTKTVVDDGVALVGPQFGMAELEHHFELAIPAGVTVSSATWNFGDGSAVVNSLAPQDHTYMTAGNYTVSVVVRDAAGVEGTLSHAITVIPPTDGMECVRELSASGPTEATVNVPVGMSVYIPACLSWRITSVRWNFGDGSSTSGNQTVSHTFTTAGQYTVTVDLFVKDSSTPFLTLTRQIEVTGGGSEEPEEPEEPQEPGPVDPGMCSTLGQTRESSGDIYTEEASCGVNGKKEMSYRDQITQTCLMSGEVMRWTETGRIKQLLSEGDCQGQACELPPQAMAGVDAVAFGIIQIGGKYYLPHGGSRTFYSSQTPAGSCTEVAETRSCTNGVLGGSTTNVYLLCFNGCPGVGPHGTTQTGVVTGETSLPKQCQYGETGVTDLFHVISDRTCDRGQVTTSNSRTGGIKLAGECPSYSWQGTDSWSACSADCGGKQTRNFECRDSAGNVAPIDRCGGLEGSPREERVCDGNPEAVRRTESSVVTEDASSSALCPKDQIGIVLKKRDTTTTKVYACINHTVALERETVTSSPWVEERHCKDYVSHRCSNDSLGVTDATKRYQWMLKCRNQVKAIDDFFTFMEDTGAKLTDKDMKYKGKLVYATFLNAASNPEKLWKAPVHVSTPCDVPETAYVATVCVASCATPEQEILAEIEKGKLGYTPFIKAWQQQLKFVATLTSQSSMSSKEVTKTAVDEWVTELQDTTQDIITFTMKSGRVLKLTPNHPLVTEQGSMKEAEDFKVGENLVMLGGVRDPIVSAVRAPYFGKVYNVFVKSNALHKNIVVTNGYLNGTAFFQNDGAQHLNRQILRGKLIKGVIGK